MFGGEEVNNLIRLNDKLYLVKVIKITSYPVTWLNTRVHQLYVTYISLQVHSKIRFTLSERE